VRLRRKRNEANAQPARTVGKTVRPLHHNSASTKTGPEARASTASDSVLANSKLAVIATNNERFQLRHMAESTSANNGASGAKAIPASATMSKVGAPAAGGH
jgi:hypothetical protein